MISGTSPGGTRLSPEGGNQGGGRLKAGRGGLVNSYLTQIADQQTAKSSYQIGKLEKQDWTGLENSRSVDAKRSFAAWWPPQGGPADIYLFFYLPKYIPLRTHTK